MRRDILEKIIVSVLDVKSKVRELLNSIYNNFYENVKRKFDENIVFVDNYEEFKIKIKENKFVLVFFCCVEEVEIKIKEETGVIIRCIFRKLLKFGKVNKCIFEECRS